MEVFYATGLRRRELVNLDLRDINETQRRVFVRAGKGNRDRVVPISARALDWMRRAIEKRPFTDDSAVFLNVAGGRLSYRYLTNLIGRYIRNSGVAKSGSCHIFRHTLATAMLENGADIRFVQELLGHVQLNTTQIYTRVSIRKLQDVYDATTPSQLVN